MTEDFFECGSDQIKSLYIDKHQKYKKGSTYRATINYTNYNVDHGIFLINQTECQSFSNEYPFDDRDISNSYESKLAKYLRFNIENKEIFEIKLNKRKNWKIEEHLSKESDKNNRNFDLKTNDEIITVQRTRNKKSMYLNEYKIYKHSRDTKENEKRLNENIPETIASSKITKKEKQIKFREPKTKSNKKVSIKTDENEIKNIEIGSFVAFNCISDSSGLKKSANKHFNRSSSRYRNLSVSGFDYVKYKNSAKTMKKNERVKKRNKLAKNASDEDFSLIKNVNNTTSNYQLNFFQNSIIKFFKHAKELKNDGSISFENFIELEKTYQDAAGVENLLINELDTNVNFKRNSSDQLCCVCFNENALNLKYYSLDACGHVACKLCWYNYFTTALDSSTQLMANLDKITHQFTCMYPECNSSISYRFLAEILAEEELNKYLKYYCELKVSKSEKYMKCTNSCGNYVVKNNSRMSTSVCSCGYSICNDCRNEAHYPLNCKQYFYFKDELEPGFEMSKICMGKRCPSCKKFIEKNGGCNHMKCICGVDFCWRCLYYSKNGRYSMHSICQEKVTQAYLHISNDALEECLLKLSELQKYHKSNMISFSKDYKSILIDAVMKSKQREVIRNIFIDKNQFQTLINLKDDKIFRKMIESSIDFFFKFINDSRELYAKICGAQHFNLKCDAKRGNLLSYVDNAKDVYKKFYAIFSRPFSASSFFCLFFIYSRLLRRARTIPKQ